MRHNKSVLCCVLVLYGGPVRPMGGPVHPIWGSIASYGGSSASYGVSSAFYVWVVQCIQKGVKCGQWWAQCVLNGVQ